MADKEKRGSQAIPPAKVEELFSSNPSSDTYEKYVPVAPVSFENYEQIFVTAAKPEPVPSNIARKPSSDRTAEKEREAEQLTLKDIASFPEHDVEVVEQERHRRTRHSTVPDDLNKEKISGTYVQDCVDFFSQNWKVVQKSSLQFTNNSLPGPVDPDKLPERLYDVDMEEDQNVKADDFNSDLLKPTSASEAKIATIRKDRVRLLSLFQSGTNDVGVLDPRNRGSVWKEHFGIRLGVTVQELSFAIGDIEPFFGSIALYDAKKKIKISENFYFDINSSSTIDLLGSNKGQRNPETLGKKALFSVSYNSPDIYLVVMINKVLQGDEDEATEPYFKHNQLKPKEKAKFDQDAKEACARLGAYRQSFCWAAVQLFNDNGDLLLKDVVEIKNLMKMKGDVYSHINEMEKDKTKQKKTFPGRLVIRVDPIESDDSKFLKGYRLDPALNKVRGSDKKPEDVIREVREFRQPEHNLYPHMSYINELYLYIETVNFNNYHNGSISSRNIAVEIRLMENDFNVQDEGLKMIHGKSTSTLLTTRELTAVNYHNKKPKFYDEIKIQLPNHLTPQHHLLVTFYHVQCNLKKAKKDERLAVCLGYTTIPMFEDNKIIRDDVHSFPVALVFPPTYRDPKVQEVIKWVDNKKAVFSCRTKLVSTVFSQDEHIDKFFKHYEVSAKNNVALCEALQNLRKAQIPAMVQFFPQLIRQIMRIICNGTANTAEEAFITLIAVVDPVFSATSQNHFLESYISYIFENEAMSSKLLYEELVRIWINITDQKHAVSNDTFKYSWFLFGIIVKSMTLKLAKTGELAEEGKARTERFSTHYVSLLQKLITFFAQQVAEKSTTSFSVAKILNSNVALFLKDLLSIMDRGSVFKIIFLYCRYIEPQNRNAVLVDFKFNFLKILIDHEHYVPLSIPMVDRVESAAVIKNVFWQNHFLPGLLLHEIEMTLLQPEPEIRLKAVETLRFALQKHEVDTRYQEPAKREAVCGFYFPFVPMVIDNLLILDNATIREKRIWFICLMYLFKGCSRKLLRDWWTKESQKLQLGFFDCLSRALEVFQYVGKERLAREPLEEILDNIDVMEMSPDSIRKDDKKDKKKYILKAQKSKGLRPATMARSDTREVLEHFYQRGSSMSSPSDRPRKGSELRPWANGNSQSISKETSRNYSVVRDFKREQNLSREISFITLDMTEEFTKDFKNEMRTRHSIFLSKVFGICTNLLSRSQPIDFLNCLFVVITSLATDFRKPLFRYANSICGELAFELLRYCNTRINITRAEAVTLLYFLISGNYKEMGNFARMKLQCTIGVSKLVGSRLKMEFEHLQKSLQIVAKRSKDKHKTKLGPEVEEMVNRLFGVIRDSLKMKQMSWNPEKTAELYYQISRGFIDSPDLRVTWLENLATYHAKKGNFEECAQAKILTAALVSGYMKLLDKFPKDFPDDFKSVFPNLDRDLVLPSVASLQSLAGEICQSFTFTEDGFIDLLKQAISMLKMGALHESCIEVYRILLPIHQKKRDYKKQSLCYADLHSLCDTVVEENETNQRLFSNYYRVAFFGKIFDEYDGKEYVYKEPSTVRLAEFSQHLQDQFANRFAAENLTDKLRILPNTKVVVRSELDPNLGYLQIIAVDVQLAPEELAHRESLFEQNFNINRFIFETPFTKSGKAHSSDMAEQYKKKTILTCDAVFPYLRKRLEIVSKAEIERTPIETAIELIQKKTVSLTVEVAAATPNIKTLQMALQGTLLAQVNAGPLEVCRVFLGDNMTRYDKKHVEQLTTAMTNFVKALGQALEVNQGLIKSDQVILQRELESALRNLKAEVTKYMILDLDTPEEESEREGEEEED
eukprot:TRINITY_DN4064_c0_g1_i2.p1 TRINITY_DN4064_c0_g1~~TRINITY_DN4064_c0_g1_i2.p1  ORF type:complete len:1824 (-),score=558.97 TRINITY_DN4064_c0_g1_i2:115-5586(-)